MKQKTVKNYILSMEQCLHQKRFMFLVSILLLVNVIYTPRAFAQTFEFESAVCPEGAEGSLSDIVCGFVTVPENWEQPNGKQIRVAVAVLESIAAEPEADPVVYIEGGPGFGTLKESWMWNDSTILRNRDLILFDQRGTGYSTPALKCSNVFDTNIEDMSDEDQLAMAFRMALGSL